MKVQYKRGFYIAGNGAWSPDLTEAVQESIAMTFGKCPACNGDGIQEIIGDGPNFEVDIIDTKPCPACEGTGEYESTNT